MPSGYFNNRAGIICEELAAWVVLLEGADRQESEYVLSDSDIGSNSRRSTFKDATCTRMTTKYPKSGCMP